MRVLTNFDNVLIMGTSFFDEGVKERLKDGDALINKLKVLMDEQDE